MSNKNLTNFLFQESTLKKEIKDNSSTIQSSLDLQKYLSDFTYQEDGKNSKTLVEQTHIYDTSIPIFTNEFWTSKQRQASPIHEISYRACFKPQLPRFFINLVTKPGDIVYDPFNGRGTTVIEAGLAGCNIIANDINPLSKILAYPRFFVPKIQDLSERLDKISFNDDNKNNIDLSMFYHPKTEAEIISLKNYLLEREEKGSADNIDHWIRMIATNRLTGHSKGFFSVYTLPPNQAVSPQRQLKINTNRNQRPEYRDVKKIILKKSRSLIKGFTSKVIENLLNIGKNAVFMTTDARYTSNIQSSSVKLVVTSPPFLNIVQYSQDNWLRCWFNNINDQLISKKITMSKTVEDWSKVMQDVFHELYRILIYGGWVAFEVGEIRKRVIKLEEYVIPLGINAGLECVGIVINSQQFTKTSNIWGINNNNSGTNTNRIVIFRKEKHE